MSLTIGTIIRSTLYQQIFSTVGVISIIGYSTYVISKNEEKKSIFLNNLLNKARDDYDKLYLCNLDYNNKIVKDDVLKSDQSARSARIDDSLLHSGTQRVSKSDNTLCDQPSPLSYKTDEYNKPLVIPEMIKVIPKCNDLYNSYKESYNTYYKNKYNIMNKYMI
jgi:hypothetical protein